MVNNRVAIERAIITEELRPEPTVLRHHHRVLFIENLKRLYADLVRVWVYSGEKSRPPCDMRCDLSHPSHRMKSHVANSTGKSEVLT